MIMIDRSKRLSEPLRWTRAGRLAVVAAAVCVILAATGLGVAALLSGPEPGKAAGCIHVTFPSTLGGADLNACGPRARTICAAPQNYASLGSALRAQCRRAGYPFG